MPTTFRPSRWHIAGAVFLLTALAGHAQLAVPSVLADVAKETYEVSGATLEEVWADIQMKGFPEGGKTYASEAVSGVGSPHVDYSPTCTQVPSSECSGGMIWRCTASMTPVWSVATTVTLPHWAGADSTCAEVRAEWERFLARLTEHEEGHGAIVDAALAAAGPQSPLTSDAFEDCTKSQALKLAEDDVEAKFAAERLRLQNVVDAANAKYDADTQHGAAQGATLDLTIKCPPVVDNSAKGKLRTLIDEDLSLVGPDGLQNSLTAKLQNAIKSIANGNNRAAIHQIDAFIKEVRAHRGKELDAVGADGMIKAAEEIKSLLK